MKSIFKKIKENPFLCLICVGAIALHFFALGRVPMAWHPDEAGSAYDAWCIANYGVDRYRNSYPVLFFNFGGGGQSALYTYMASIFIKIFGVSLYVFRIPAAIMSLAVLFSGLGVLNLLGADKYKKIIWAGLYTVMPYFFMAGRIGLDCNLMLGTSSVFLFFLILALKKDKTWMYIVAGITGGIVLYTYTISYLVMILFVIFTFVFMVVYKKLTWKKAVDFCIPLMFLAVPLVIVQIVNIFDLETLRIWKFTFVKLTGYRGGEVGFPRISRLPQVLKAIFLYDGIGYNTNPKFLMMYCISIPFFVIGFVKAVYDFVKKIKAKEFEPSVVLLFWFAAEIIVGMMLGGDGPNTNKLNGIFFCTLYYVVGGIVYVIEKVKYKKAVFFAIAGCYLVFAVFFFGYYFLKEKDVKQTGFNGTFEKAMEIIENDESLDGKSVYIGWGVETYIYYFLTTLPSPFEKHVEECYGGCDRYTFYLPDEVDMYACYILLGWSDIYDRLESAGFETIQLENDMKLVY